MGTAKYLDIPLLSVTLGRRSLTKQFCNLYNELQYIFRFSLSEEPNATNATIDGKPLFQITQSSTQLKAAIEAARPLSSHSGYWFVTVVAKNPGEATGTERLVVIQVMDVNDEDPIFVKPSKDNDFAFVLEV